MRGRRVAGGCCRYLNDPDHAVHFTSQVVEPMAEMDKLDAQPNTVLLEPLIRVSRARRTFWFFSPRICVPAGGLLDDGG